MPQLTEFLKEKLPTPASRWVGVVTVSIALALLYLPETAPKIGMAPIGPETLWLRLFLVSTILFLGSFVILLLLSRHIEKLQNQLNSLRSMHEAVSAFKRLEASSDALLTQNPRTGPLSQVHGAKNP